MNVKLFILCLFIACAVSIGGAFVAASYGTGQTQCVVIKP